MSKGLILLQSAINIRIGIEAIKIRVFIRNTESDMNTRSEKLGKYRCQLFFQKHDAFRGIKEP
jgi:hypothetical protein